jgi:hypothetical protein
MAQREGRSGELFDIPQAEGGGMRRFVVKFKVGGPELWRTAAIEKTTVNARNVAMAMYEFHRKHGQASEKMTVTEVYEEG